jgi:hypothetical protein
MLNLIISYQAGILTDGEVEKLETGIRRKFGVPVE